MNFMVDAQLQIPFIVSAFESHDYIELTPSAVIIHV